jgi:hypothetical protein
MVIKPIAAANRNDYDDEDLLCECEQIYLKQHRKSNSKRKGLPFQVFLRDHIRKQVENSFAMITNLLPRHIHTTSIEGFLLKILLIYSLLQFYKRSNLGYIQHLR